MDAPQKESIKTKLYILRSHRNAGLCLIVEAESPEEAQARAKNLTASNCLTLSQLVLLASKLDSYELTPKLVAMEELNPATLGGNMRRYDFFQIESDGRPLWLGAAENVQEARERIRRQPSDAPCEFQIVDQVTGDIQVVRQEEAPSNTHDAQIRKLLSLHRSN